MLTSETNKQFNQIIPYKFSEDSRKNCAATERKQNSAVYSIP